MTGLLHDLRYAARALVKAPGFTVVALLTIAVGTGANATVFSFVNALLLRQAPGVADARSLVAIYTSDFSSGPYGDTSYPDYQSIQQSTPALIGLAAHADEGAAIVRRGTATERLRVSRVSGGFFNTLGLRVAFGRLIAESDAAPAAPPVAVLSHDLWRRMFDANPSVIGTSLMVNGVSRTIIGIAPERFTGLDLGRPLDMWIPLLPDDGPDARQNRGLAIVGRLAPGASIRQAQLQLNGLADRLAREFPATNMGTLESPDRPRPLIVLAHTRIPPELRGEVKAIGGVLMGAVGVVLLIACANVASLLLSRASARDREIAVRRALGAGRRRLFRQLLTESLCLAALGGSLGLLLSLWTSDALPSFFPAELARLLDVAIDWRVLCFVGGVSLLSGIVFGLAPALHALAPSPSLTLRGDARVMGGGSRGSVLRMMVVTSQVALAVVLLGSAALLTRSLVNILNADIGVGTRRALVATIELPAAETSVEQASVFFDEMVRRVERLPGVESVTLLSSLPLGGMPRRGFRIPGYTPRPGEDMEFHYNIVGERYSSTLKIPLVAGREFERGDSATALRVAMVNDVFAARFFNGGSGDAIGRDIVDSGNRTLRIVGVMKAARHLTVQGPLVPMVYYPFPQTGQRRSRVAIRTATEPAALAETVRREIAALNPAAAVFEVSTLEARIAEAFAGDRLTASLVGVSAAMALLLALVGVYGIIAYGVVRRTREIGVRVALGANRSSIIWLVMSEGLRTATIGVVVGTVLTTIAGSLLSSMLYGVGRFDRAAYVVVPLIFLAFASLAGWLPTRRALRVEPMIALRHE